MSDGGAEFSGIRKEEKLIVAIDYPLEKPEYAQGRKMAERLFDLVIWYKIGLGMLATGGMQLAKDLKDQQKKVFLDLKLFDIPQTIENSVRGLTDSDPNYLTVHGDPKVVEAAVKGRDSTGHSNPKILAVTLLTSVDRDDLDRMLLVKGSITDLVVARAREAFAAGADGVICSPMEAAVIRNLPEASSKLLVTPGVRPSHSEAGDQKRVATPRDAITSGASQIVVGRPIVSASDPVKATKEILEELA